MTGDLEIDPPPDERKPAHRPDSPHPWWSRALYAIYALAAVGAAVAAVVHDETALAVGAGGMALILLWKAAQRVR